MMSTISSVNNWVSSFVGTKGPGPSVYASLHMPSLCSCLNLLPFASLITPPGLNDSFLHHRFAQSTIPTNHQSSMERNRKLGIRNRETVSCLIAAHAQASGASQLQSIYMFCMFCTVIECLSVWVFELFCSPARSRSEPTPQHPLLLCVKVLAIGNWNWQHFHIGNIWGRET